MDKLLVQLAYPLSLALCLVVAAFIALLLRRRVWVAGFPLERGQVYRCYMSTVPIKLAVCWGVAQRHGGKDRGKGKRGGVEFSAVLLVTSEKRGGADAPESRDSTCRAVHVV